MPFGYSHTSVLQREAIHKKKSPAAACSAPHQLAPTRVLSVHHNSNCVVAHVQFAVSIDNIGSSNSIRQALLALAAVDSDAVWLMLTSLEAPDAPPPPPRPGPGFPPFKQVNLWQHNLDTEHVALCTSTTLDPSPSSMFGAAMHVSDERLCETCRILLHIVQVLPLRRQAGGAGAAVEGRGRRAAALLARLPGDVAWHSRATIEGSAAQG